MTMRSALAAQVQGDEESKTVAPPAVDLTQVAAAVAEASAEAEVAARASSQAAREAETAARAAWQKDGNASTASRIADSHQVKSAIDAARDAAAEATAAAQAAAEAKSAWASASKSREAAAATNNASLGVHQDASRAAAAPAMATAASAEHMPVAGAATSIFWGSWHGRLALLHRSVRGSTFSPILAMVLMILVGLVAGMVIVAAATKNKDMDDPLHQQHLQQRLVGHMVPSQAFPMPRASVSAVGGGHGHLPRLSEASNTEAYPRPSSVRPFGSQRGLSLASAAGLSPRELPREGAAPQHPLQTRVSTLGGASAGGPQLPDKSIGMQQPLCPDLVVPQASECSLMVPCLLDRAGQPAHASSGASKSDTTVVTVDDSRGTPVFRAALSSPASALRSGGATSSRCLTISSASGEALFAVAREKEAKRTIAICDHSDKLYGDLQMTERWGNGYTFVLTATTGHRITFRNDNALNGSMNATADDGRLLSIVDAAQHSAEGMRRSVIIGPLVDAGLIVLCLLSIDWLRSDR
eukprot:TRINITY_DN11447_c0_g1_i4.p1 TRINITY_DN11447_c0_g1~~TRINITY_DN11447_c0_g1_i4.p1  ORF type:complete len:527 (+),score=70.14 TRINITY_DN11447_c0_g1_i4:161-1741(+)